MSHKVVQLPETRWDWRAPYYQDVMKLITPGFLTAPVQITGGPTLHLRTLLPTDFILLNARTKGGDVQNSIAWLLAHSVWMVDGRYLLDKPRNVEKLYEVFKHFPSYVLSLIYGQYEGLQKRFQDCGEALEPFLYEHVSRNTWRQFEAGGVYRAEGLEGVDKLGRNYIQRAWHLWNHTQDQTEAILESWKPFRFIASAVDSKGVERMNAAEQKMRDAEEARRSVVRDKFYWQQLGVVPKDSDNVQSTSEARGTTIKSVETLEDEMARWVSGEADEHDNFVESYKQRALLYRDAVLLAWEEAAKEAEERQHVQEVEDAEMGYLPTSLTAYSLQELEGLGIPIHSGARHIPATEWANQDRLLSMAKRGADKGMLRVNKATGKIEMTGDAPQLALDSSGNIVNLEGEEDE